MKTRKEAAREARVAGLKQFICEWVPCSVCGGTVFFTASCGCKHCVYERTRKQRATEERKRKESEYRKKEWQKNKDNSEYKKKRKQSQQEYNKRKMQRLNENPEKKEEFLQKKREAYRRWYYSEKGNKKALDNVRQWQKKHPHHVFLRKMLEQLDMRVSDIALDRTVDDVLGYSKDDFIKHIKSTMLPWMSFDDRNNWHIDHILSVNWFVKNNLVYPELVNALHNLKAEPAEYNYKKNRKWLRTDMTEWEFCYMLQYMVYGEIRYKEGG